MEPTPARTMLLRYGLAPSRERGQNFLVDPNVARKVVDAVAPADDELVVEIGSGFGAITFGLAERAAHVVCVEYDAGIVRAFREEYGRPDGVTLVEGDALEFDLRSAAREHGVPRVVVAGNLPYNLTSPVIRLLIGSKEVVSRAIIMVQREVADRLLADPGTPSYSALTAVVAFHARIRAHFAVRRTCFHPRPAVDSKVVEMGFLSAPKRSADPRTYSDVVHAAFGKRRKMLRQALADVAEGAGVGVERLGTDAGLDLERRGETLSVEEFERLALAVSGAQAGSGSRGGRE
ncbi:MAG: 16S rRNA (adenine(1518)-N(6)/adenine(1519)-N(6))-dimethyltransferase RsmA [Candidatus Eisenbacteria bacterium]